MKNIFIVLVILVSIIGCEKDTNLFEGTEWTRDLSTGSSDLSFSSSSFTISSLDDYGERLSKSKGDYVVVDGIAILEFNSSTFADHEAEISGSTLNLTNLSTNKTFRYERK